MPLTESQVLSIAEILNTDETIVKAYADALDDDGRLTPERIARIDQQIANWEAIKNDFFAIEPTGTNKGFRTSSELAKREVARVLSVLLEMPRMLSNMRTITISPQIGRY